MKFKVLLLHFLLFGRIEIFDFFVSFQPRVKEGFMFLELYWIGEYICLELWLPVSFIY